MDSKTLIDRIQEWLHLKRKESVADFADPPIPAELFNADQMERHGISLALSHTLTEHPAPDILLSRLAESEAILTHSCALLMQKTANDFSPAREWLLDNYYLIQEEINAIRCHLPKGYGRTLPQLTGTIPGYPRVYAIALEIIEHGDGRWDLENLSHFISAYQSVTKLTLGELWAIPIILGIALIENLSSASKRIVADRHDRMLANNWVDLMVEVAVSQPKKLVIIIADMARSEPTMSSAFVAEFARRLQDAALALPLNWIEQHLAEDGMTIEQLILEENKYQAANQVTISNSIASLRRLGETNWRHFVEAMSIVEQTLRLDPTVTYQNMDFGTRDHYRHVVERLARKSKLSEETVAMRAIQLAQTKMKSLAAISDLDSEKMRYGHVGFYLIDKGLQELERILGLRSFQQKVLHLLSRCVLFNYLGSILIITGGLVYLVELLLVQSGISYLWCWIIGVTMAVYGSQLAVSLVNLGATLLVAPSPLPRMDFTKGIPAAYRTLVVVPALFSCRTEIETLVEALEVRFLGNRDPHLHFMLLTDFKDAPEENRPEDQALLTYAESLIHALNERYSNQKNDLFFLCHRRRQWNAREQVWMGRERKRGKLADLNNLLQEHIQSPFLLIVGQREILHHIKYVITLDSDTELPRESARQFVGTMAHPLNQPYFDRARQRVIRGYGILQPRIAEVLPLKGPTRYVRLMGSELGIDPYTRTVSDVYQDLFHEGSFIGKGIYDVHLFQQVLGQCFPDNTILSHDLLEGCYLRSGFLSDVPLYEKSPGSYLADAKRRMRWIRGDWQLIGWLLLNVFNKEGRLVSNPLSWLSKWKIIDNLRRSLVPIALLILFELSWIFLPATLFWQAILVSLVLFPTVMNIFLELVRKPEDRLPGQHMATIAAVAKRYSGQLILYLACLPHEAWYSLSAILRTLLRMFITKRHLLEWEPSDQTERRLQNTLAKWLINMWMGPLTACITILILVMFGRFESLLLATPLCLLWVASPLIAYGLSRPYQQAEPKLNALQLRFLKSIARKTWDFFDTFMTDENHWLPPDNYQETPVKALARRTSPTNIGLALLANLTAYDFGYINMRQLLTRTRNTFQTLSKLERYRGHFYNWYDTETLAPLLPRYVSTVDSGNLAGHLLTLRQGLLALPEMPLLNTTYLDGLEDTSEVLANKLIKSTSLSYALKHFHEIVNKARLEFTSWSNALICCNELCVAAGQIKTLLPETDTAVNEITEWSNKLLAQCHALQEEITIFASFQGLSATITLRELDTLSVNTHLNVVNEVKARLEIIDRLAEFAFSLAEMDVGFLYNEANHIMTIGFNVETQRADSSHYDLLASEARLGSYVAIAQGQTLQESWFALGRLLVSNGKEPILISWSGSMFEYLMPLLVMPNYPDTLLDQTCQRAVHRQIAYGKQRGVPWGISESGLNAIDSQFNYSYRAFGVPGLGLKRGLEEDLVIAPYASAMALMVVPLAACLNLQRLAADYGAVGQFGFYEAIDFTLARLPRDSKKAIVRSFMTHHQGMVFLSISYLLHKKPMQQRFAADPLFQAALPLLQERIPKPTAIYLQIPKSAISNVAPNRPEESIRVFNTPNTRTPQVQLLSNGQYHLVLTQAGGSYSHWKDIALTRWREDSTSDDWGMFSYVRDLTTGEFWSTNYQPTLVAADNFKTVFTEGHAEFSRNDHDLDLHTEVVVSPEDDIELRRLRMHNRAKTRRIIEFTSYAEIVLAPLAMDLAQPAFSNLFVETECLPEHRAILVTRRPQDEKQSTPWLCHLLNVYHESNEEPLLFSFETDRARFIGRCRTTVAPLAMIEKGDLSNTQGAVLDPIVAIRCQIVLEPDALVIFDLLTGVTDDRAHAVALVEKYQDRRLANRIFGLTWTHGQVLLHQLNISEANAELYGKLASAIIYASSTRRAEANIIASNRRGQPGLWGYSISGDLPIVLLYIDDAANIELVQQLIQAQAYWRHKGLVVDLVILNEERISYRQTLQDLIMSLITGYTAAERGGNIVVRVAEQIPLEDRLLLQSVARIVLSDKRGTLREQLIRRRLNPPMIPVLNINQSYRNWVIRKLEPLPNDLQFFNGLGGFTSAGDEYIIRLGEGAVTPAPWVNILVNPNFGTLVSESGQGYTWTENAHEFRLTPWDNDPLKDSAAEAIYLRDDETGLIWSPTALPSRGRGDYQIRHGFGYSVFEHVEDGIYSELWIYVARDVSLKFSVLKIRNDSMRPRKLSATGYVGWVLGDLRSKNAMHIVTELSKSGAILAHNHYNTEFGERVAFFDAATAHGELTGRTVTCNRTEFIGRNGTLAEPAALKRKRLSGAVGAGLDPCGAIQLTFEIAEGQTRDIVFTLGAGKDRADAETLIQQYHDHAAAKVVLASVRQYWQSLLHGLRVSTPDPALNLLANGWLIYQVLSSRLWGRSGYYQSGGAFGFRDQLQDVMALTHIAPQLFRAHLLLSAAHQFEEGDVQHWWHPPQNRGVRTRCSDDYLWLPFALCHYIATTDDIAILDEKIPFLQGRLLKEDEDSYYELGTIGNEPFSLYQHAVRAITHGLRWGVHGLPLMGSGDWNDGMNLVGHLGKGESVWLGFFLYSVLKQFAPIAARYGDQTFAERCKMESDQLQQKIRDHGWDGEWYRRAYFDDGTPLGSSSNMECRIDSIAQSWSVLSDAAEPLRAKAAMTAMYNELVNTHDQLVKLLDPPFNKSIPNPGYIEGYVPGIRENGGQYTHAAIWAAMAFAELGEKERAWQLFNILNPIHHGRNVAEIKRYKIEPYVIAGDIYSVAPHTGRGGWSWYTGSAGWFYRLITETLLGVQLIQGKRLTCKPLLPADWNELSLDYVFGRSLYKIQVKRISGTGRILMDEIALTEDAILLEDDGLVHQVTINIPQ